MAGPIATSAFNRLGQYASSPGTEPLLLPLRHITIIVNNNSIYVPLFLNATRQFVWLRNLAESMHIVQLHSSIKNVTEQKESSSKVIFCQ